MCVFKGEQSGKGHGTPGILCLNERESSFQRRELGHRCSLRLKSGAVELLQNTQNKDEWYSFVAFRIVA